MDDRPFVDVVELRRIPRIVPLLDSFEFRKDRPAHWLQRICLWTLRNLGCYSSKEVEEVTRHVIGRRGETFMNRLLKAKAAIWGHLEREPQTLLLGSEQYAELMHEVPSNVTFSFGAEYYMGNGANRRPTVVGLTVKVIPWMRGMLLLPDSPASGEADAT